MQVDVRLVIAVASVLLMVGLALAFAYFARILRKEHETRFNRIRRELERDAAALVDRLLRRS